MRTSVFFGSLTLLISGIQATKQGSETSFFYSSSTNTFDYSKMTDIVIFGDSYSSVSTNYTTMDYSGLNMSMDKNWGIYLAEDIHPMKLWDYAYDGAVIDTNIVNAVTPVYPMTEQYEIFLNNMSAGKPFESEWNGDSTLFAIWFGINDLVAKMVNGADITDDTISEEIDTKDLTSMFNIVQGLYDNGAKNFIFFYVPAIHKTPVYGSYQIIRSPEEIDKFNMKLKSFVEDFHKLHSDTNVFIYDAYDEFLYILENNTSFNITEVNTYCRSILGIGDVCSNPENYFWADAIHPTFKVHEIIAKDVDVFLNANSHEELTTTTTTTTTTTKSSIYTEASKACWATRLGYKCCKKTKTVVYEDDSGLWGVEEHEWCGLIRTKKTCWSEPLGYPCCKDPYAPVYYKDRNGRWSIEHGHWCGINKKY